MTNKITDATGTYKFTSWDEKPYAELDGAPKVTHSVVTNVYAGDLTGEGRSQLLMFYRSDASAVCFGLERVTGSLAGRSGSFVLRSEATFEDGVARTTWSVVPGSATGELAGLQGAGAFTFQMGEADAKYHLRYDFE
jgi:Protein of unknown function (DUF3224)